LIFLSLSLIQRTEIPFVFEVPTTLEALHEMIAKYASTGKDASTIIQRIHKANSVRLDRRNVEKMQNFYDVLLRRFVAVGDAIFASGDGGEELNRYEQLTCLTKVMYAMAQDSPESAGAVWSRRIGIFQNAHAKRLRDSEFIHEEDEDDELVTAWPSTGTFLLLRALGHIFPVTDRRHYVVAPTILLLSQMVAQTPVSSPYDLIMGILCSGLLLEYTKEAKRVIPEVLGFLAGAIRLFSPNPGHFAVPSLEAAYNLPSIKSLRDALSGTKKVDGKLPSLKLERDFFTDASPDMSVAVLSASLDLVEKVTKALEGSFSLAVETELLCEVSESILSLRPKSFPEALQSRVAKTASIIAKACPSKRKPLRRRTGPSTIEKAIKSLAPRMQDPDKYSMSKDKGKKSAEAAIDRTRREYKREHKAISRELRLDAAFIENERRTEQDKKDTKARAKRQKNFAWLEGEQATMNQEVRMGGGLLKGGGTGVARAKAATGKLGMKKGHKF
jgi:nucleolar protein 14